MLTVTHCMGRYVAKIRTPDGHMYTGWSECPLEAAYWCLEIGADCFTCNQMYESWSKNLAARFASEVDDKIMSSCLPQPTSLSTYGVTTIGPPP